MRRATLWVIDPSSTHPEDQGVQEVLHDWPGRVRLFQPALKAADGLCDRTGYATDGVVLLGSSASVYDRLPWLEGLSRWIRPLLTGQVRRPLLGICFGHQLIAHLAGATVGFLAEDRAKRLAVEDSRLQESGLLPGRRDLRVVVSHREVVEGCPPGYRVTAQRPGVPFDGLEHTQLPVHSFQFHPEAREEFAVRSGLAPAVIDQRLIADGRALLAAFGDLVLAEVATKKNEPADNPPARTGRG